MGHKRALGWGTFFAVILTGGLWLLTLLFYPSRCIVCGSKTQRAWWEGPRPLWEEPSKKEEHEHA
jgi:hypothetical protein